MSEGAIADHAFLTNNGVYTQYAKLFSDTVFDTAATGFSLSMSVINTPNEMSREDPLLERTHGTSTILYLPFDIIMRDTQQWR